MHIYGIIGKDSHNTDLQRVMDYMKTIKTLASEIGVTKQAIFQKMKKEPLASSLNNLTTRVGGIVYVYPEGEGMIKEQFHKMQQIFTMPHVDDNGVDTNIDTINILRDNINTLEEQLNRKDRQLEALNLHISVKSKQIESLNKQIEEISTALAVAQEQIKTAQSLHAGDIHREIIGMLIESQKNANKKAKKKGFWKKIFKPKAAQD